MLTTDIAKSASDLDNVDVLDCGNYVRSNL